MADSPTAFDAAGIQYAWDATSLKWADTCPRLYQYYREGWQTPHRSVHLWFGGIYASSLELFHKLSANGTPREDAIREVIRFALIESWDHDRDDSGTRIEGTGGPTTFDHATKSRETLIRTLVWYFDFFIEDTFSTYITTEGKPAVEFSFKLPVDNGVVFCGHIDRLAVDHESNIFVHDQKTTATTLSPYYFKQFKPDLQLGFMYPFAGRAIYNIPIKGVIVDAAQIAVGFSKFARAPVLTTESELNESYNEVMELIERTRGYARENHFPRRPASCNNYGGCAFREVCSRPSSVRENFLKADFVKREPWNPMRER